MNKQFDMELFLSGVLTGAHTTRERHIRQAKAIQTEIVDRWHRDNPWTWQRKHLIWFLRKTKENKSNSTYYYYTLTVKLINIRLKTKHKLKKSIAP
ncbi:hypothetical protein SAMN04489798_0672 [Pseudomonas arsenicoxydans]|uniref:Uncharacterized protein n=1 Tax=Pseudomonas arsenicoxydans TaxID=702115 RepID=A0A1H0CMW7_9PSED|nr:hypothetical protein [Pseudomonas arsenicoxydans]SDN59239.1 hypothetical protein SAMN04489798_0672 [Pseudomonas arsenicoxydans]